MSQEHKELKWTDSTGRSTGGRLLKRACPLPKQNEEIKLSVLCETGETQAMDTWLTVVSYRVFFMDV